MIFPFKGRVYYDDAPQTMMCWVKLFRAKAVVPQTPGATRRFGSSDQKPMDVVVFEF